MKAADLIKEVRSSTQLLWDSHMRYIESAERWVCLVLRQTY